MSQESVVAAEGEGTAPERPDDQVEFSDYQILLLRADHPNGFLFDTKRDIATGQVFIAGYRRGPDGRPGQLEEAGVPVGAELTAVNDVVIEGSRARYLHCVNLLKGEQVNLYIRIYGDLDLPEDDNPSVPDGEGRGERPVGSPLPPAAGSASAGSASGGANHRTVEIPRAHSTDGGDRASTPSPRVSVVAGSVGAADAAGTVSGLVAGLSTMLEALGSSDTAPPNSADATVVPFVVKVLRSPGFSHFLSQRGLPQYYQSFLPACVGEYMARYLPAEQVENLFKFVKGQVDQALFSTFRGSSAYVMHAASTGKDARMFCLQAALHRSFPMLASEGWKAVSQPPVFYLTEGSPVHDALDRYMFDLLLTRESVHVIPLKSVGGGGAATPLVPSVSSSSTSSISSAAAASAAVPSSAGAGYFSPFPTYQLDVAFLERQIAADRAAGRLPCAVLAAFGAEASRPYQCDDLVALRAVCDAHNMWLHVDGSSLLLAASPQPSPLASSPFETAHSLVLEPMDWFGSRSTLAFAMIRGSKAGAHHHQRHLVPPPVPTAVEDFNSHFVLWYHLIGSHRPMHAPPSQQQQQPNSARRPSHGETFLGTPVRPDSGSAAGSSSSVLRPSGADLVHGRLRGDTLLSHYVAHNLELCVQLRVGLLNGGNFKTVLGPGPDHPHVVLFQLAPPDSMAVPLEEMNLTLNSFNKVVFGRLHYLYTLKHRGLPLPEYAAAAGLVSVVDPVAAAEAEAESDEEFRERAASMPTHVRRELEALRHRRSTHRQSQQQQQQQQQGRDGRRTPTTPTPRRRLSHGGGLGSLFRLESSPSGSIPLPLSQIAYDGKIGFLFHPLAQRTGLGSSSMLNHLGGVDGELGGSGPQSTPLRSLLSQASVDTLLSLVRSEVRIIERAARGRAVFCEHLRGLSELRYVPPSAVPGTFVGVGAFRFVANFPIPREHSNALNVHLANLLSERNPIYRGVVTSDRLVCTVIQASDWLTDNVEECVYGLVQEVLDVARKMELPPEVVEGLSSVVIKGIKEAEAKLQSANDEAYAPDSLFRKIPLVGTLFNWILPAEPNEKHPGRSQVFDLRGADPHPRPAREVLQLGSRAGGVPPAAAPQPAASDAAAAEQQNGEAAGGAGAESSQPR